MQQDKILSNRGAPPPPPATGHNPQWSPPPATEIKSGNGALPPTTRSNPVLVSSPRLRLGHSATAMGSPPAPTPKASSGDPQPHHYCQARFGLFAESLSFMDFSSEAQDSAAQQPDTSQTPGFGSSLRGRRNPPEERSNLQCARSQTTGDEHKRTVRPSRPRLPPREVREVRTVLAEGSLVWTGDLDAGQQIDLGAPSSAGSISSSLPGVPVTVEVHPPSVRVVTPLRPQKRLRWRHLVVAVTMAGKQGS